MKKLLSLVTLATILTGFSVAQGASLPVEGTWGIVLSDNGITFDMTVKLENQTMTTRNVCTLAGRSLVASVTVPANYDGTTITVLAHGEHNVSENGMNCNVSVQPDRMNYVVNGSSLVLTHDGRPDQFVLQRR
jgi:hypothetical protein